jgi:hypothetical protein
MPSLNDQYLKFSCQRVQTLGSYEDVTQSFWMHLYTKHVFKDLKYGVEYERAPIPELQGQRKIDQIVKEFIPDEGMAAVLLFHEIKRNEIDSAGLETVEMQTYDACVAYCDKYLVDRIYAQTSVGTRARFWVYGRTSKVWEAFDKGMLGSFGAYEEFGDDEGEKSIMDSLKHIRSKGPVLPPQSVPPKFTVYTLLTVQ